MADRSAPIYEEGEADRLPSHDHEVYNRIAREDDFIELRRRYGSFAFPATIAFMAWYFLYVICANWARGFMDTKVVGNINIALVWGLLQFVSTFAIAATTCEATLPATSSWTQAARRPMPKASAKKAWTAGTAARPGLLGQAANDRRRRDLEKPPATFIPAVSREPAPRDVHQEAGKFLAAGFQRGDHQTLRQRPRMEHAQPALRKGLADHDHRLAHGR